MQTHEPAGLTPVENDVDRCRAYIYCQLEEQKRPLPHGGLSPPGPAVTLSYLTGSGEHTVARRLAGILRAGEPDGAVPWTVFDRQLIEEVLKEHHLPRELARFMPEERRSYIRDTMEELLGLRPPSWVMVPQIAETVLHLADAGHVILVGRGANFITARMPNVFHVRLVASLPRRIARTQKLNCLTRTEAAAWVVRRDRGRGRYLKAHFHAHAGNDLHYHLVINTDRIPCAAAAKLIAKGARRCFQNTAKYPTDSEENVLLAVHRRKAGVFPTARTE
jgi:cytidylate kinase